MRLSKSIEDKILQPLGIKYDGDDYRSAEDLWLTSEHITFLVLQYLVKNKEYVEIENAGLWYINNNLNGHKTLSEAIFALADSLLDDK